MLLYLSFSYMASLIVSLCKGVNGCSVTPSSAAVVAGDNLSLTCKTKDTSEFVTSWTMESDSYSAPLLYQAPNLERGVNRTVADGYLVNDSNRNIQMILTIVQASTSQANYYYCLCSTRAHDFALVSVLVSEPTFTNATEITDGDPVVFNCSVSFNGTANTSITIEDLSGNSLNTSNYDGSSKILHSFSLNYSVIADSSISQQYYCNNKFTDDTSGSLIFSRRLNASVLWLSVRKVQINPIDGTQCMNGQKCSLKQTVRCTAEGNPMPVKFQWLISANGSVIPTTETSEDILNFITTGNYEVQCIALNQFAGIRYNSSSSVFKTQVVNEPINYPTQGYQRTQNKTGLIIGLVVGLGGSTIILMIIAVVIVFCKRKKRQQSKADAYTNLDVQRSEPSVVPQQDLYTELQAPPVDHGRHRVEAEYCETRLDFNGDK